MDFTINFPPFLTDFGKQIFAPYAKRIAQQCGILAAAARWPEVLEDMEGWVPSGALTSSAGEFAGHTHTFKSMKMGRKELFGDPPTMKQFSYFAYPLQFRFCWIIEPGRVCKIILIPRLILMKTRPGGKSIYSQHLSAPNAWTQSQKVNNEGIYVVRVRMLRPRRLESINKYKCSTFCEIFIA